MKTICVLSLLALMILNISETFHNKNKVSHFVVDGNEDFIFEKTYIIKNKVEKASKKKKTFFKSKKKKDKEDIYKYILSKKSLFPHIIILGICNAESSFKKKISNKKSSAKGCMQVLYPTGKWIHEDILKYKTPYNHNRNNTDYKYNIDLAIALLNHYYKHTNYDIDKTLLYYRGENDLCYFKSVKKYKK